MRPSLCTYSFSQVVFDDSSTDLHIALVFAAPPPIFQDLEVEAVIHQNTSTLIKFIYVPLAIIPMVAGVDARVAILGERMSRSSPGRVANQTNLPSQLL